MSWRSWLSRGEVVDNEGLEGDWASRLPADGPLADDRREDDRLAQDGLWQPCESGGEGRA
jgi:hypothetical protein